MAFSQEFSWLKGVFDRPHWSCKHFEVITVSHHRNCTVIEDSLSPKPSSLQLFLLLSESIILCFKAFPKPRKEWKLRWVWGFPESCEYCVDSDKIRNLYMYFQLRTLTDRYNGFVKNFHGVNVWSYWKKSEVSSFMCRMNISCLGFLWLISCLILKKTYGETNLAEWLLFCSSHLKLPSL